MHSHSARTSVLRHERSEGRRPKFKEQTQSNTHFFKNAPKASRVLLCSSCTLQASYVKLKARKTLSSQAPNMLCSCLFLLTPTNGSSSSQLMQCKLVVHVTCARHPVNSKGTHKKVKNFHIQEKDEGAVQANPGSCPGDVARGPNLNDKIHAYPHSGRHL